MSRTRTNNIYFCSRDIDRLLQGAISNNADEGVAAVAFIHILTVRNQELVVQNRRLVDLDDITAVEGPSKPSPLRCLSGFLRLEIWI